WVMAECTRVVRGALPDADRGRVGRLGRRALPLVHRVVRDAVQPDLAVAPGLLGRPLDALVEVFRLARRPDVETAWRAACAARVDAHARIAVRHPLLGIDHFPVLVLVRGARGHVGMLLDHPAPLVRVEILEVEPLAVRAVGQDHRVLAVTWRTKHVGAQHEVVVDADGDGPVDAHAVAELAREVGHRRPRSRTKSNVAALTPPPSLTRITSSRLKMGSLALMVSPGK